MTYDPWSSPLDQLCDTHERAGDDYRQALDDEAVAENDYRRAHAVAWVRYAETAVTARSKACENTPEVVEARCAWNLAIARTRACFSKVEEIRSRIMAKQSDQRFVRESTGG